MATLTRDDRVSVQFVIPREADDALERLADEQGKTKSDVVRDALRVYFEQSGYVVDLAIQHGGNQRRTRDDDDQDTQPTTPPTEK